jgi:uncharacterized protein (DUF1499 family)
MTKTYLRFVQNGCIDHKNARRGVTAEADWGMNIAMLRTIRHISYALLAVLALSIITFIATTKEESVLAAAYELVFGSPDLGAVDFETLKRGPKPNTALACPVGFCKNAQPDFVPPIYAMSEEKLRALITKRALAEPGVIPVYRHESPGLPTQDRYVQRTPLMRFPDTINIRFIVLTENTTTLAVFSRSQIGHSDMGVNLARIRRWLDIPAQP